MRRLLVEKLDVVVRALPGNIVIKELKLHFELVSEMRTGAKLSRTSLMSSEGRSFRYDGNSIEFRNETIFNVDILYQQRRRVD